MNQLVDWYSKGFWIATFALVLWHAIKEKDGWAKLAQLGLVLGFTIYAISFSFLRVSAATKLQFLTIDLLSLGFISLFFHAIRHYKKFYWLAVILLYAFSKLFVGQWQKDQMLNETDIINPENEWEFLVEIKNNNSLLELKKLAQTYDLIIQPAFLLKDQGTSTSLDEYYAIEIPQEKENQLLDFKAHISALKDVIWIEDNELITVEPDIPAHEFRIPFKPKVNDPYTDKQWAAEVLGWNKVWDFYDKGLVPLKKKSKIFILDTGVDGNHEDLKDHFKSIDKKNDTDEKGHGTHVAGIAAAVSNNKIGISSVIPDSKFAEIYSIKVLGKFGSGTQRDIINGIIKAVDNGATVINMSLGGRSLDNRQKAYSDAISYANAKGCIVVVAAGNDNADARNYAPANATGVITVSAIDSSGNKASFSNTVEHIQYKIAAPGADIFSTIPNNQYAPFNGTSMAAPYVTGLVALIKSMHPEMNTEEVYQLLNASGSESLNTAITGKIINAGAVMERMVKGDER